MERLHNAKMAQAIKDYMKGFKYTRCRKEPKKPIPRREPTGVLSPKELWRYRYSMARFKRRFEAYKRWHNCKRQMDDAERYFRSEEFAAETGYRYKPDEIIERMKRKIRHMGRSGEDLAKLAGTGSWLKGARHGGSVSENELRAWVDGLK